MELDIDSTTNFDSAPKKSFLMPAGMGMQEDEDEIGDIPLDSVTSME